MLEKLKNRDNLIIVLLFATSLACFFIFGFYRLSKFETTDEHYWIQERVPQYWDAVSEGKWKKTLINDKPGVSLAFVSGIGLLFEKNPVMHEKIEKHISSYDPESTLRLNKIFRTPLLIFNGLFSIYFFWIIRKISKKKWLTLWSSMFILLSPILLGISRIINPDSLLWVFSFASVLSFIAYTRLREKKLLALGAFFLGFSLLSKYIAFFLYPLIFSIMIFYFIDNLEKWNDEKSLKKNLLAYSIGFWLIVLGSIFLFSLFFPAVIFGKKYFEQKTVITILKQVKIIFPAMFIINIAIVLISRFFSEKLTNSFSKILSRSKDLFSKIIYAVLILIFIMILANWVLGSDFLHLSRIPFDARKETTFYQNANIYEKALLEFYPIVFSISPLVLASIIFLWIKSIFRKSSLDYMVLPLSFFLLTYEGASIANNLLATIRYNIIIYPSIFLLAAIGVFELLKYFSNQRKYIVFSVIILLFGLTSLWQAKPFYFEYTNSLLPKNYLITGSWGQGGYEAAQYLNSIPDAHNLMIWADYSGTCEFFIGKCIKEYKVKEYKEDIDYYVLTRRGEIRYNPDHTRWTTNPDNVDAYKYYKKENPDWLFEINGRPGDFIKIFKKESS